MNEPATSELPAVHWRLDNQDRKAGAFQPAEIRQQVDRLRLTLTLRCDPPGGSPSPLQAAHVAARQRRNDDLLAGIASQLRGRPAFGLFAAVRDQLQAARLDLQRAQAREDELAAGRRVLELSSEAGLGDQIVAADARLTEARRQTVTAGQRVAALEAEVLSRKKAVDVEAQRLVGEQARRLYVELQAKQDRLLQQILDKIGAELTQLAILDRLKFGEVLTPGAYLPAVDLQQLLETLPAPDPEPVEMTSPEPPAVEGQPEVTTETEPAPPTPEPALATAGGSRRRK